MKKNKFKDVFLFNGRVPLKSPSQQFFFLVFGIFFCYLFYGYFQEHITTTTKRYASRKMGWLVTFCQFVVTFLGSAMVTPFSSSPKKKQWIIYCFIALCSAGSMGMSNKSSEFLNYPTQVVFKCGKVIMVMLVGKLFFRKEYILLDYLSVIFVSVGLLLFTAGDAMAKAKLNSWIGIAYIIGALTCDAFIGNLQEAAMKNHKCKPSDVLLYSKGIGAVFLFVVVLIKGEFNSSSKFWYEGEFTIFQNIFCLSLCSFVGENFVMAMIRRFDPVLTVMVTNIRKALTILLSFLFFPKHFTWLYPLGGMVVAVGVILGVYRKNKARMKLLVRRIVNRTTLLPKRSKTVRVI